MKKIEQWIETRSGMSGGAEGPTKGASKPNMTSIKLFRGYTVGDVRFDREHYRSYADCRQAAEDYAGEASL